MRTLSLSLSLTHTHTHTHTQTHTHSLFTLQTERCEDHSRKWTEKQSRQGLRLATTSITKLPNLKKKKQLKESLLTAQMIVKITVTKRQKKKEGFGKA